MIQIVFLGVKLHLRKLFSRHFYRSRQSFSLCGLECLLGIDHGLHTVVHVLNKLSLGKTETSLVGDVVGSVSALRVLTVDTADLHVVFVSDFVELCLVLGKKRQLDVD